MDHNSAGIKAAPAPAPSRGFVLWIALLLLYFLLLPSAAESGSAVSGAAPGALASAPPAAAVADATPGLDRPPGAYRR